MKNEFRARVERAAAVVIACICLYPGFSAPATAQTQAPAPGDAPKGKVITMQAKGTFDVKLAPQEDKAADPTLTRLTIDKQFHGDLEGTSKGQMLGAGTDVKGSAGYVAIERVTGTLAGRSGSFTLQHSGTMDRGAPQLTITVVPDSGTGQLTGLTGRLMIKITEGKHFYEFEYTLPAA